MGRKDSTGWFSPKFLHGLSGKLIRIFCLHTDTSFGKYRLYQDVVAFSVSLSTLGFNIVNKHFTGVLFIVMAMFALVSAGCKYTPTDTYYHDIIQPDSIPIWISLNDYAPDDTIKVYGTAYFQYSTKSDDHQVYEVRFFIDNDLVNSSTDSVAFFSFNTTLFNDGLHSFTMEIYVSTETGSMADKLGSEYSIASHTWELIIDNRDMDNFEEVQIQEIRPEDGRLKIYWNKFNGNYFQSYILRKYGNEIEKTLAVIRNGNTTSWTDSSYIGGQVQYELEIVLDKFGQISRLTNERVDYESPPSHFIGYEFVDITTSKLFWSKLKFRSNFGEYQLWTSGRTFPHNQTECTAPDTSESIVFIQDTVFTFSPNIFGDWQIYWLKTVPENLEYFVCNTCDHFEAGMGYSSYTFESILYNVQEDLYYMIDRDPYYPTHIIDAESLLLIGEQDSFREICVSPTGEYVYVGRGDEIHALNASTLNATQIWNINDLIGHMLYPRYLSVSDNNLLMFGDTDTLAVVDMSTETLLTYIRNTSAPFGSISGNGDYFSDGQNLYSVSGTDVTSIGEVGKWGSFWEDNGKSFWVEVEPDFITIYNPGDLTIQNTISHKFSEFDGPDYFDDIGIKTYNIDRQTGTIAIFKFFGNSLCIYDLETGQMLEQIGTVEQIIYRLKNEMLFSSEGYRLPLDLK